METSGQAIRYRVTFPNSTANRRYPAFLAGPSCDSMDIIYPPAIFDAPEDVTTGDPVCFFSAGAYTASYASVEFNGFAPLPVHVADVPGEAESQGS